MVFLLAIFITTGEISTVQPSYSSTQAQAQTFIENVLPIDSSKYNITLRNYGVPSLPDINVDKQNDRLYDGREVLTYSLDSIAQSMLFAISTMVTSTYVMQPLEKAVC